MISIHIYVYICLNFMVTTRPKPQPASNYMTQSLGASITAHIKTAQVDSRGIQQAPLPLERHVFHGCPNTPNRFHDQKRPDFFQICTGPALMIKTVPTVLGYNMREATPSQAKPLKQTNSPGKHFAAWHRARLLRLGFLPKPDAVHEAPGESRFLTIWLCLALGFHNLSSSAFPHSR